jgi:nucleotide-binding universal stress UspA family protein
MGGTMSLVLATDGMPHTSKAVDYALEYARLHQEPLFVVYIISPRNEENREGALNEAKQHMEEVRTRAMEQGVEVTTLLESGPPAESCVAVAERVGASAIVVGTSGKTMLDRVLIGSVSEHVVRNAPCTVIVVK